MKIYSRPPQDDVVTIGSGHAQLNLNDEQLELITTLICHCRLGQNGYAHAAFEILEMISEEYGDDYINEACDLVDLHATVEDRRGTVLFSTKSGDYDLTLEV